MLEFSGVSFGSIMILPMKYQSVPMFLGLLTWQGVNRALVVSDIQKITGNCV
jgi:hypothetical protein